MSGVSSELAILQKGRQGHVLDPRQFKLTNEHPNGVLIRFLPGLNGQAAIRAYTRHTVPHVNRYVTSRYMQPCPQDLGGRCPVCDFGGDVGRRSFQYAANVVVAGQFEDDAATVKILEFGVQIANKLIAAEKAGIKPYDVGPAGSTFQLKATFKGVAPSYAPSQFLPQPEPLPDAEDFLAERHDLSTFPTLPSYDVLVEQFQRFTGLK